MNIKSLFLALAVIVVMQVGLVADLPFVAGLLPWIAAGAVLSALWPIVALVLGAFGILAFNDAKAPTVEFDLSKPGHKLGYLVYLMTGKTIRLVRKGASSVLNKAGKWVEPAPKGKKVVVVSSLFGKD